MYGQNIDGKNLPPELTRSKANTKAIAFCRRKLRGLNTDIFGELIPNNTTHIYELLLHNTFSESYYKIILHIILSSYQTILKPPEFLSSSSVKQYFSINFLLNKTGIFRELLPNIIITTINHFYLTHPFTWFFTQILTLPKIKEIK